MSRSLVSEVRARGVELQRSPTGGLRWVCLRPAPRSVLSWVAAHKQALLAELLLALIAALPDDQRGCLREELEERAAILEYEAGLSRDQAERLAASMVLSRWSASATEQPNLGQVRKTAPAQSLTARPGLLKTGSQKLSEVSA